MSLLPHSNIRVDNFEFMKNDLTQYVFFLTHCHEGKSFKPRHSTTDIDFSLIPQKFNKP